MNKSLVTQCSKCRPVGIVLTAVMPSVCHDKHPYVVSVKVTTALPLTPVNECSLMCEISGHKTMGRGAGVVQWGRILHKRCSHL